eukprot:TRINITY_DN14816_c0_g1_i1.p1 TRINITY_DN14816_c0_g1~~TRINITY_DN14816_c0_g1_i1.p1  ORF type:complete len:151 (+),score=25.41 TRINITY_DN14816_c0_g1_i1:412-864(+)
MAACRASLLVLFFFFVAPGPCLAAPLSWSSCTPAGSPVQITSVKVTPDPAKRGSAPNAFSFTGTSKVAIKSGTVNVKVSYNAGIFKNIQVPVPPFNICSIIKCPSGPGLISASFKQTFPSLTPKGDYSVKVTATSGSSTLFCVAFTFTIA